MKVADASAPPRWVGVSLGDLADLQNGGLGEFCLQVGTRLAAAAAALANGRCRLAFHVHRRLVGCFGDHVLYLPVTRLHRLVHRSEQRFDLWHSLHQLNKNLPPSATGVRIVTVHDLNYQYSGKPFSIWRHQRRTLALMRRTDSLVASSHHTAADVRKHLSWTGEISVIHLGARSFVSAPLEPLPGWQPEDTRPFLFHLSRMSASKNPQAIIDMARLWPDMTFVLCGPPSDDAKRLRATVHLPNLQFHLGISDAQKAWAYAHCSGFLFPSLTEGFGLPPIEAMHFGKPVFLAPRTSLPEIGGEAADYFNDFAPEAMKQVVQLGLQRNTLPGRAAAIRLHAAQFDWDRTAAAYMALYRRLLKLPAA